MKLTVLKHSTFLSLLLGFILSNTLMAQTTLFSGGGITHTDLDGTASNTFGAVDVSNCTSVVFSFDYQFSLPWVGSGNMESSDECGPNGPCAGDPGAPIAGGCVTCWDFLQVDFLIDGSPVGGDFIGEPGTTDAEQNGTIFTDFCTGGLSSSAQINVLTQNWASDEAVTYSNITIVCYEAAPTAMASPAIVCTSESVNLEGSVTDIGVVTNINWSGPGIIDDPSSLNTFASNLPAGNHTFTLTTTDDNGCNSTSDVNVEVLAPPIIGTPDPLEICFSFSPPSGEIFNLSTVENQLTGGDGSLTLEWWFDMDATIPITDVLDLLNAPLPSSIFATVTDGNGCQSAAQEVFFNATPYPILGTNNGVLNECPQPNGEAVFTPSDADGQFTAGDGSLSVTYHNTMGEAESGSGAIFGTVTTSSNLQLFVRVVNGVGCATIATLDLLLDNNLFANDAIINACDEGGGQGIFDLTSVENQVLNGNAGTVLYFEDFGLTIPILDPFAYSSTGGSVYAAIDDGNGCISAPGEIMLELDIFDPNDFFLSFSPLSGCGATEVGITLHTPAFPIGEYGFSIEYGPMATGLNTSTTIFGSDGDEALTLNIDEPYIFSLISVTSPDPQNCFIDFMPEQEYSVIISSATDATPAELSVCPEEDGQGVFDLLSLQDSINRNTADTVLFFEDFDLNIPVIRPDSFVTMPPDTIFAVIDEGGGCISTPVEVLLTLDTVPEFSIVLQQAISCTGASDAILNVQDTIGSIPFSYDWSNDDWDGLTNHSNVGPGQYFLTVTDINMCSATDSITVADPPALTLDCHENGPLEGNGVGTYSFSYNGGTPNYSLSLTGPFNDTFGSSNPGVWNTALLPGGTYTLTLTDANNCMESCTFTICDLAIDCTQTTSPSTPGGSNGSLMLDIMDGTPNYSIAWSGTSSGSTVSMASGATNIPNLSAGNYSLTVTDANNCIDSCSFTINPANCTFSVETSTTNILCNGDSTGTISFVFTDGIPDYTFAWSDNNLNSSGANGDQNNLPAGDYAVTITDQNNCQVSENINLSEPASLLLDCHQNIEGEGNGAGSYSFAYSGGTPFYVLDLSGPVNITFTVNTPDTWDTAILPEGNYTFTLSDSNGCSDSCSFVIPPPCDLSIDCSDTNSPSTFIASDGSLDLLITGGTPPYSVNWMGPVTDNGTALIPGVFTMNNLTVGPYTVTVMDANGCEEICGFLISNPACNFMANISGTAIECNGDSTGTIGFTFVNGAPDYTFTWNIPELNSQGPNGNQVNLPAGDYTVTIVDNNSCDTTLSITLNEPPAIQLACTALMQPSQSSNSDGMIDIVISGGSGGLFTISYDNQNGTSGAIPGNIGSNMISNLPEGTYDILVSDGNCDESCSVVLTASNCSFDVNILAVNESCLGANDGTATVVASGGNPEYIINWSTMEDTASINNLSPAIYYVTVTDGAGCLALDSIEILAGFNSPTLNFGTPASTICADSCLTIDLTLTGQAPFIVDYLIQDQTGTSFVAQLTLNDLTGQLEICPADLNLQAGPIDVLFSAISDANCDTIINQSFQFNYLPLALGSVDTVLCSGETFTLGGILFDENNLSDQVVLANMGSFGCDSLVDVNIQYYEVADTLIEQNICQNDTLLIGGELFHSNHLNANILLENSSTNGCDSMITVNLMVSETLYGTLNTTLCAGDTTIIEGQAFHENLLLDTIPLNTLSSSGCDTALIVTIDLLEVPVSMINADICPGDSMLIGGQFFHESLLSDTILINNAAVNGCDSIIEVNLSLLSIPTFDLSTQICEGDTLFIGNNYFQVTAGMMSYTLENMASNGCDSIVNVDLSFYEAANSSIDPILCTGDTLMIGDQIFHAEQASGLVILEGASVNGCDSTIMVNANFLPNVMGNLDTLLCFGESLQIADQTFNAETPNGIVIFENAAANGCDSTLFVNTSYSDELSASLTGGTVICPGESVDLLLNTTNNFTYDYTIEQENGGLLEGSNIMGNQTLAVSPNQSTVFTLTNISSISNCPILISESTTAVLVSNLEVSAEVSSDFNGFGVSCADLSDGEGQANVIDGIGPFTYLWSTGATTPAINNLSTGAYSVLITDGAGCTSQAAISITSPMAIDADIQGIADGCFGENGGRIQIDTITNGTPPYEYSVDGEFFNTVNGFPTQIPQLASGNHTVFIQDANDCSIETAMNVPTPFELTIFFDEHDIPITLGDSVLLSPMLNFTPVTATWTPPTFLSQPDHHITYAAPPESIIYELELADENGCIVRDMVRIFVDQRSEIYVPTAFSPNEDGTNDVIYPYASSNVEIINSFQIFDRWGNLVFTESGFFPNDPHHGWDGRFNTELLNAAVFVYVLEATLVNGEELIQKGEIILMR